MELSHKDKILIVSLKNKGVISEFSFPINSDSNVYREIKDKIEKNEKFEYNISGVRFESLSKDSFTISNGKFCISLCRDEIYLVLAYIFSNLLKLDVTLETIITRYLRINDTWIPLTSNDISFIKNIKSNEDVLYYSHFVLSINKNIITINYKDKKFSFEFLSFKDIIDQL